MLISLERISRNSSQILRVLEHDFISKEIVKSTVRGGWGNQGEERGCFWKKEGGGHKVLCPPAQIHCGGLVVFNISGRMGTIEN